MYALLRFSYRRLRDSFSYSGSSLRQVGTPDSVESRLDRRFNLQLSAGHHPPVTGLARERREQ
jgi:hypothetical protein